MENLSVFIIVYFLAFAIVDFIIYIILSKYLYMSGGATRDDVKLYLSEQRANGQRRLVEWLRNRTPKPKMFATMFKVCTVLTGVTALAPLFIMVLNIYKNKILIILCVVAVAVISTATALYGFSYSKKIKEAFTYYFDSSQYKAYTGEVLSEYIDSEADLYKIPKKTKFDFSQAEKDKIDKQIKVGRRISTFVIFAFFISIPVWALIQNMTNDSKTDDTTTKVVQEITDAENEKNPFALEGVAPYDAYYETQMQFIDFEFSDCTAIKDEGLYFGFYELYDETSAAELQKTIKTKILNDYGEEKYNGQDENNETFTKFSYETDNIYAVSICCDNCVIYAYSDSHNEEWLKSYLNYLGYLEDF